MFVDSVTVAVVDCANNNKQLVSMHDLRKMGAELEGGKVPTVCVGQRTVVPPAKVEASETREANCAGSLPFPKIDPKELKCGRGKVAYGDSR